MEKRVAPPLRFVIARCVLDELWCSNLIDPAKMKQFATVAERILTRYAPRDYERVLPRRREDAKEVE